MSKRRSDAARQPLTEEEQQESLRRIEAGGIPLLAQRRLSELGDGGGAFTSDLSVTDFALCHQLGLKPLSQVMGTSIYQIGYQPVGFGYGAEMNEMHTLSQAWNEARDRAFARLAAEAASVGADVVVGVAMRSGAAPWTEVGGYGAIEYLVNGTAVKREARLNSSGDERAVSHGDTHDGGHGARQESGDGGAQSRSDRSRRHAGDGARSPILTELSVADYAKLLAAGIEPVGIVAWTSVFFVSLFNIQSQRPLLSGAAYQNFEYSEVTQCFYEARERVTAQLGRQAQALRASGIVGVRIGHTTQAQTIGGGGPGSAQRSGLVVSFSAIGTAVHDAGATRSQAPQPTIDLTT